MRGKMTEKKNRLFNAWKDKGRTTSDVEKHLLHHLDEVKELIKNKGEHRFMECADLDILVYLYFRYSDKNLGKHVRSRLNKFFKKLEEDP